jgi:predicted amidohydrolase YtcJ
MLDEISWRVQQDIRNQQSHDWYMIIGSRAEDSRWQEKYIQLNPLHESWRTRF